MLASPHAIHYGIDSYTTVRGYSICEEVSYQWLAYRKIVFVDSVETCTKLAN